MPYQESAQRGAAPLGGAPIVTRDLDNLKGSVTQITSAVTAVTLNKLSGRITTVAGTLAAAGEEAFDVINSLVRDDDVVVASLQSYGGAGTPLIVVDEVLNGAFRIAVLNLHASAALNALLIINFVVIKAPRVLV